jgi:predicted  nucleic acid-binding Zn-ribbon protein
MEVVKQITKEQLTKIVDQQKDLQTLLTNIGILESQKHGFLHQLGELNKAIEEFKGELEAEYGAININIEDGSYTDVEKTIEE